MSGFGENVRRKRLERGWTQAELGRRCDRSSDTISRWERGAKTPDLDGALVVAEALGCPLGELVGAPAVEAVP